MSKNITFVLHNVYLCHSVPMPLALTTTGTNANRQKIREITENRAYSVSWDLSAESVPKYLRQHQSETFRCRSVQTVEYTCIIDRLQTPCRAGSLMVFYSCYTGFFNPVLKQFQNQGFYEKLVSGLNPVSKS